MSHITILKAAAPVMSYRDEFEISPLSPYQPTNERVVSEHPERQFVVFVLLAHNFEDADGGGATGFGRTVNRRHLVRTRTLPSVHVDTRARILHLGMVLGMVFLASEVLKPLTV